MKGGLKKQSSCYKGKAWIQRLADKYCHSLSLSLMYHFQAILCKKMAMLNKLVCEGEQEQLEPLLKCICQMKVQYIQLQLLLKIFCDRIQKQLQV